MKIAKIAGILVAVLVVVLVIFLATFDIGKYKGTIQEQAKAATGRDVQIGDIKMSFSLTPAVTLSDVTVANAPWGTRPQMLILKKVEAHLELIPLLSGTVNITSLTADSPDAWLETDRQGKANWDFSAGKPAPAQAAGSNSGDGGLNIGGITAKDLKLSYKDGKTGNGTAGTIKTVALKLDGPLAAMNITRIDLGDADVSLQDGKETTDIVLGKLNVEAKGKITDYGITSFALTDAKLSTRGAPGAPMEAVVDKLSLDKDGVFVLTGKINGQDLKGKGTLAPVATLMAMNKPFPAKLSLEAAGFKFDSDLQVAMVNNRPSAKGTITIPEFDLSAGIPAAAGVPVEKGAPAAPAANGSMFSEAPLPWEALKGLDADVKISIGKLTLPGGVVASNVSLPVNLTNGKLVLAPFAAGFAGGSVNGDLQADANDRTFALKADSKGLTAEALAKEMKKGGLITQGALTLQVNVRGGGNSAHAVMAGLNGAFFADMGPARIKSEAINMVGGDVVSQVANILNPAAKQSPYTDAKCAVVNLPISNGVATSTNGIAFVSDKMQVTSSGTINFGADRVDLSVSPKATGGLGIGLGSLSQAMRIQGTLEHPGVGIDKAGAAKALSTLGLAFATGGGSILAQGAKDRVAPGGDPCQAARTTKVAAKK